MEERTGEAFELGEQLTVVGSKLNRGDSAPDFGLDSFDGETMRTIHLSDSAGKVPLAMRLASMLFSMISTP